MPKIWLLEPHQDQGKMMILTFVWTMNWDLQKTALLVGMICFQKNLFQHGLRIYFTKLESLSFPSPNHTSFHFNQQIFKLVENFSTNTMLYKTFTSGSFFFP